MITIGYFVGLAPRDPRYQPNPWFSTCHILSGSALIASLLTRAGENVEEDVSMNMFEALRRQEDYERKMRRENPLPEDEGGGDGKGEGEGGSGKWQ